ncbi:MAG: hypothetical protein WD075_07000 [Rhodospirillales bacterium]
MKPIGNQQVPVKAIRLRIEFGDAAVTHDIPANATYEDIARSLSKLSKWRYGSPLAIYATFESSPQ